MQTYTMSFCLTCTNVIHMAGILFNIIIIKALLAKHAGKDLIKHSKSRKVKVKCEFKKFIYNS